MRSDACQASKWDNEKFYITEIYSPQLYSKLPNEKRKEDKTYYGNGN